MRKRYLVFAAVLLIVSLAGIACNDSVLNPKETIIFSNRSGMNGVNCYIDGAFKGVANNGQDLYVEGDHEGDVVLSADGPALWGPNTYFVADGGTFIWTLTR